MMKPNEHTGETAKSATDQAIPRIKKQMSMSARIGPDGIPIFKQVPTIQEEEQEIKGPAKWRHKCTNYLLCRCSKRFYTAWMCCFGFMITFGIRCNIGWVTLQMRNNTHPAAAEIPEAIEIANITTKPDFYWTSKQRGMVDSSFFYGYMVTQIPGGVIASKFPANRLFGIAVGGSALVNLLVPASCRMHYGAVIFLRIVQGLVEGVSYPACHGIWRYWAPPIERSRLATIAFCGSYAGAVISLFMSGILTEKFGWQFPFYLYGVVGLIWLSFWWRTTYEKPATHPKITPEEREYIEMSIGEVHVPPELQSIPWKAIFTSMPVYAIIIANIARSWSFFLLIMMSPTYLKDVFNYTTAESGILSSLPHLFMAIIVPISGQLADRLRKRTLTTTAVRKIFNCGGFGMEAILLLVVGYADSAQTAMIALIFAVSFSGFAISGYNVNHLDIAPRYASILMGLSNGIGTISGLICPLTAELITEKPTKKAWSYVFLIASCVHFFGVAFYAIFASGEKQHWAEVEGETPKRWDAPNDLPADIVKPGYGYGDDEATGLATVVPASSGDGYSVGYNQRASATAAAAAAAYQTQTYRATNRSLNEDDPYHQQY